jgi:hypothetical protein
MDVPTTRSTVASVDEVKDILHPKLNSPAKTPVDTEKENEKEVNELDIDAAMAKEHLRRLIEDNKARKTFSYWIFIATVLWMFFVLMIVVQVGRRSIMLSDGVLIALITTTTANVFGFLYVVVNYLFNKNKST